MTKDNEPGLKKGGGIEIKDNEIGLKEGGGIEMSTTVLSIYAMHALLRFCIYLPTNGARRDRILCDPQLDIAT